MLASKQKDKSSYINSQIYQTVDMGLEVSINERNYININISQTL